MTGRMNNMLTYYLQIAIKSLRRTPATSALMIGAIALGVGVCVTTLTVYHLMSRNPIKDRNDVLYAVTLDNWDPNKPFDEKRPELPPNELTYRDATALLASKIPDRQVAMEKGAFILEVDSKSGVKPFPVLARLTTRDFFAMFAVPFQYGAVWDESADEEARHVVVLSKAISDKIFGGQNSVGKTLRLSGQDYKVVGVLAEWMPVPKFYDVNNGAFDEPEDVFVPFGIAGREDVRNAGNVNCWRNESLNSLQDFLNSECIWIQYWAELRDRSQVEAFQNFIDNYVREQKKLGRFERPLNNHLRRPDEWLRVNQVVEADNSMLVGLSFTFLAVCLLNMIGLLLSKFLGAASHVGIRRALGASRMNIFTQHLVEVAVIGIAGGVLGIGVALLGLFGVRQLYDKYDALTRLDLTMGLVAVVIAISSGVVAGLYPTWRVCSIQPATYLKTQ
jgi:putative ABC transport system permease protein